MTSKARRVLATTLAALALLASSRVAAAQAAPAPQAEAAQDLINPDRPGIADGSKVIGAGRFQLETGIQEEYRDGAAKTHTLFIPTLVRIGVGERWEARVEGNTFTRVSTIGTDMTSAATSGFAPLSVGFKYAILDADHGRPSVGAIVRAFPASGSNDVKTEHFTADARLVADWDVAPKFSVNPNVGFARYESGGRTFGAFLFAFTLNYQPTDKLNPFVDVGYQHPSEPGGSGVAIFDAGVAYIVGRNVQLDVSLGSGNGDAPQPFVAVGISIRTGRATHHP